MSPSHQHGQFTPVVVFNPVHHVPIAAKNNKVYSKTKTQFKKVERASESDPDMAEVLKLTDWESKTSMINIPVVQLEKVDNMQEYTSDVS